MGGVGRRVVKVGKNSGHIEGAAIQVARATAPEVTEKAQRRRFTAEYKSDILRKAEAVEHGSGELGELLRKEGLYSSHLLTSLCANELETPPLQSLVSRASSS